MNELKVVTVKSKGRKKKTVRKIKKLDFSNVLNGLQFVNQQINKLPGTILVAGGMAFFEYAHAELKGVIGCIDFKVIMCITLLCFLLGVKSCIHEVKETIKLKQEVAQLKRKNRRLRER